MNKYEIRVNNAVIYSSGLNEWYAMKNLGLFACIGDMIDFVRTSEPSERNGAWIYQAELNGSLVIVYVKRIG